MKNWRLEEKANSSIAELISYVEELEAENEVLEALVSKHESTIDDLKLESEELLETLNSLNTNED